MTHGSTSGARKPKRVSRAIKYMEATAKNHTSNMPCVVARSQNCTRPCRKRCWEHASLFLHPAASARSHLKPASAIMAVTCLWKMDWWIERRSTSAPNTGSGDALHARARYTKASGGADVHGLGGRHDHTVVKWSCHIIWRNEVGWHTHLQTTIEIPARGGKRIRPTVADKKKAPVGPSSGSILQTTEL